MKRGFQMVFDVKLSNSRKVSEFVGIANSFPCTIKAFSDKYSVNAKSIMGMLALDLGKEIKIEIEDNFADSFGKAIEEFITEK